MRCLLTLVVGFRQDMAMTAHPRLGGLPYYKALVRVAELRDTRAGRGRLRGWGGGCSRCAPDPENTRPRTARERRPGL